MNRLRREVGFAAAALGVLLACFGVMWLAEVIYPGAMGPVGGMPPVQGQR